MSSLLYRLLFCIAVAGGLLYLYIDGHNDMTGLQREIPKQEKRLRLLRAENRRLQYEVEKFESPAHLLELARQPQFAHLKFPTEGEIIHWRSEATDATES